MDDDEESVSTSGCSSMVPHFDRQSEYQQEVLPLDEPALERFRGQLQNDVQDPERTMASALKNVERSESRVRKKQRLGPPVISSYDLGRFRCKQAVAAMLRLLILWFTISGSRSKDGIGTSSLWSEETKQSEGAKPQPATTGRRPSFNISAFGSPLFVSHFSCVILLAVCPNSSIMIGLFADKQVEGLDPVQFRQRVHLLSW